MKIWLLVLVCIGIWFILPIFVNTKSGALVYANIVRDDAAAICTSLCIHIFIFISKITRKWTLKEKRQNERRVCVLMG